VNSSEGAFIFDKCHFRRPTREISPCESAVGAQPALAPPLAHLRQSRGSVPWQPGSRLSSRASRRRRHSAVQRDGRVVIVERRRDSRRSTPAFPCFAVRDTLFSPRIAAEIGETRKRLRSRGRRRIPTARAPARARGEISSRSQVGSRSRGPQHRQRLVCARQIQIDRIVARRCVRNRANGGRPPVSPRPLSRPPIARDNSAFIFYPTRTKLARH